MEIIVASNKKVKLDQSQIIVLKQLNFLQKQITKSSIKSPIKMALKAIFTKKTLIKNLYIYGQVGRGKSMLMRHFFDNLPTSKKIYFHFNFFMQKVHQELFALRKNLAQHNFQKQQNLVFLATKNLIKDNEVICFDEMQVEDVADAMILQEVFGYFIKNNIKVITTSNLHPLDLYENGLQRDLFLKFVKEILLKNFLVLNLDNQIDYRLESKPLNKAYKQHYFYPINQENKKNILAILNQETAGNNLQELEIKVLGRKLLIKKTYKNKNIAVFDFKELCEQNLGVADYQAICQEFNIIFLLNVPILKAENRNEAKRLIWFIDEVYESKVEIFVLANAKPEEIYIKGIGFKAFKRTASRLNEMII